MATSPTTLICTYYDTYGVMNGMDYENVFVYYGSGSTWTLLGSTSGNTSTWGCPLTAISTTDSVKIVETAQGYDGTDSPNSVYNEWVTPVLDANRLNAVTWGGMPASMPPVNNFTLTNTTITNISFSTVASCPVSLLHSRIFAQGVIVNG